MKIVILSGAGEPSYSSNKAISHALRVLGHDVVFIGPGYFDRYEADILLPDRLHIEYYSFEEILSRVSWQPDLILNVEPHAFLCGPKPPEIKSVFYATDAHRAGSLYYEVARQGTFDHVFLAQKYFLPLFTDLPCQVHYLPVGFDERRFPLDREVNPVVDISFVGQTGLAKVVYEYRDHVGNYATITPEIYGLSRYAFSVHPGFDYSERAELLFRLCRDFQVRIYESVWDTPQYMQALQKGAIGFNCSLLHDLSIRCLEIAGAGQFLVTDDVEDVVEIFTTPKSEKRELLCAVYSLHYKPFFPNFDLDYKEVYKTIKYWLDHGQDREDLEDRAREHVWNHHTWRHRAQKLLEVVFE